MALSFFAVMRRTPRYEIKLDAFLADNFVNSVAHCGCGASCNYDFLCCANKFCKEGYRERKSLTRTLKNWKEGYRGRKSLTCTLGNRKGRVQRKKKFHLYPQKSQGRVQRNKKPQKLKRGAMLANLPFKIVPVILFLKEKIILAKQ